MDDWKSYIKQYEKLNELWNQIPEPLNTLFSQQINFFVQFQVVEFNEWTTGPYCEYSCTDENQWTHNYTNENITTEELYKIFKGENRQT